MIRYLRPGELVPTHTPLRYVTTHGYVALRWKVGPRQYVEVYEHRVTAGRVTTAEHVHHINHDKTDNRAENLQPMTAAEHHLQHAGPNPAACERMYLDGMNTVEIARELGINPATVSRTLKRRGIQTRPANIRRITVIDDDRLRRLYDAGLSAGRIADVMQIERHVIDRRFRQLGLAPRPLGYKTPPDAISRVGGAA